jgi:hypothetical protein
MEEKGWGIHAEDLAKERGGRHRAVECAHAGHTATGESPMGEAAPMLEHTGAGH